MGRTPPTNLVSENWDKCYCMWCKNMVVDFFHFNTIHAFDRQTDGRTERPSQYRVLHYMQLHGKNVPIKLHPILGPVWGRGTPLSPLSIYFFIFSPFTFPFLSLALPIFFLCPSLPFLIYQNRPTPFPGRRS